MARAARVLAVLRDAPPEQVAAVNPTIAKMRDALIDRAIVEFRAGHGDADATAQMLGMEKITHACGSCTLHPGTRYGWCASGCGRDYPPHGPEREHAWATLPTFVAGEAAP